MIPREPLLVILVRRVDRIPMPCLPQAGSTASETQAGTSKSLSRPPLPGKRYASNNSDVLPVQIRGTLP